MNLAFTEHSPAAVVNFAAETHVDRSIDGPMPFIETNIVGTFVLLEAALALTRTQPEDERKAFRFLHVSTDEVYGTLGAEGLFREDTPYAPNSPYAASKASADHLVRAYFHTYGLSTVITNCSNNYGPYQFPEKVIPLFVTNLMDGATVPLYGEGSQVRDWLHVDDHCRGIALVLAGGRTGEVYNIGGGTELTNAELTAKLIEATGRDESFIERIIDPRGGGHDQRYSVDHSKISDELGYQPQVPFDKGLADTVTWYRENRDWWEPLKARSAIDR
jgi:dTDP-glucose 4,6-dehydratase